MSDIYNKNAREAYLMAEAYTNIYKEGNYSANDLRLQQIQVGSQVMWDGMMKSGQVEEVDLENGVAVVVDEDGGDHIVELGDFDVILPAEDAEMQFDSRGFAYNTPAGREAEDSHYPEDMDTIKVGNIYKGESYHELVVGVRGDEVFTKKITLEDGNRYDANQMLDEVKLAGKLNIDFLNEVL